MLWATKGCREALGLLVPLYQQLACLQEQLAEKGCAVTKWDEHLRVKEQGQRG